MKSNLSRLLHLGVTISRRLSDGGDGIAVEEGQMVVKSYLAGVVCLLLGWSMKKL